MKKFGLMIFVFLIVAMLLVGCGSDSVPASKVPTKFECFQQGVKIVDTYTADGAVKRLISSGDYSVRSWVWEEKDGTKKYLTDSDSVSCSQYIVGK